MVEILDGFDGLGGAIFSDGFASLTVSGSTFSGNAAVAGDGGVSGSEFGTAGNARGGAIYFEGFSSFQGLNVARSTFSGNQVFAGTDWGLYYTDDITVMITDQGAGFDMSQIPPDRVGLGSRVVVECQDTRQTETYHLVFGDSENFEEGHVTMASPIGRALIGKAVGDDVFLKLPARTRKLRILELRTIHEE